MTPEQLAYLQGDKAQAFDDLTKTMHRIHENASTAPSSHVSMHHEALAAGYDHARNYLAENPELAAFYRSLGGVATEDIDASQFETSLTQLEGYVRKGLIVPEVVSAARAEFAEASSVARIVGNVGVFEELFGDVVVVDTADAAQTETAPKTKRTSKNKGEADDIEWPPHRALDESDTIALTNLKLDFKVDCILRYALSHGAFRLEELSRDLAFINDMDDQEYDIFKKQIFPAIMEEISKAVEERGYRPIWVETGRTRGRRYKLSTLIDETEETEPPVLSTRVRVAAAVPPVLDEISSRISQVREMPIERRSGPQNEEHLALARSIRFTERVTEAVHAMATASEPSSDKWKRIKQRIAEKLDISEDESGQVLENLAQAEIIYKDRRDGAAFVVFEPPVERGTQGHPAGSAAETNEAEKGYSELEQMIISEISTHLFGRDVSRGETEQNLLRLVQDRLNITIEPEDFKVLTRKLAQTPHFLRKSGQYKGWHLYFANQDSKTGFRNGTLLIKDEFPLPELADQPAR